LALAGPAGRAEAAGPVVQRIMLIRHAEKPIGSALPYGVTAQGVRDFRALTIDGWNRAGALVELFAPSIVPIRAGLGRPGTIFAAPASMLNESLRPTQTVTPLPQRSGRAS
ncbi:MAG: hypothetical protein M3R30_07090, partial [Candidatus Eremiobacteraeota bacterium]|nr:hypothetical protein [Candidatus Eremiobacteraeota bacterium]